jgi:DNA repair exonuclease SbcCD ATPase subunit
MRKPTVAAWVTNLVARKAPDELDDLLALGDEFREATADLDGDRLRELTPKRHELLDKLSKEAARLAGEAGQKISADVGQKLRETLDAALVDPAAGDAVREGRLSSALRHVGFGVVDENGEPSNVTPLTDERRQAARDRRKTQQAKTDAAQEKAAAAREQEEREAAERAKARKVFEEAVAAAQEAEAKVEDLDTKLDNAREALAEAQALVHRLGADLDEARRTAREAQKESREARKRYNRL